MYPGRIDWLVRFAHLLTKVKFGLLPIGLVFLIIIVVVWFIQKRPASNVPGKPQQISGNQTEVLDAVYSGNRQK
jgi:hypothetical protein